MSSVKVGINLAVKASGRSAVKGIAADVGALEKAIKKARAATQKARGDFAGPLLPSGNYFSQSDPLKAYERGNFEGPALPNGRYLSGSSDPVVKTTRKRARETLKFSAAASLAADNFMRVGNAGKRLLEKPIEEFFSLEQAMARVQSKMDVLSAEDYQRLKKAAIQTGAQIGYSSTEAADGLGELAASGFSVEQQLSALPAVLSLAKAGELAVGQASGIAVSTMSQFGLTARDTAHIGDVLVAAANASVISVGDLAETMKFVGPIAHAAGISLEETAAAAAVLGNAGIDASMAGTSLRATIAAFAKQTPRARKAMEAVGISAKQMSAGVHEPLKLLELLGKKLAKADEAKKLKTLSDVFGAPAAPGAAALMDAISKVGEDGLTAIQRAREATNNANGQLERAARILTSTGQGKLKLFRSQLDMVATQLGETLAPTLLDNTQKAGKLVSAFGKWSAENPRLVTGLGRIAFGVTGISLGAGAVLRVLGAGAPLWSGISTGARFAGRSIVTLTTQMEALTASELGVSAGAATAITGLFAVPAAAAGGWWLGKELDSAIGKLFDLRGGLLSTEAALQAGEGAGRHSNARDSDTWAKTDLSKTEREQQERWDRFLDAVVPGHKGNRERNALEDQFEREQRLREGALQLKPRNVSPAVPQFNAVSGQLEIFVTDDRIRTKLTGSTGRVGLRTVK